MSGQKQMSMAAAVSEIDSGDSIAMGLALEHAIPFAVGHELIRQEVDDLTLIGPISDLLFDQLIGAGSVATVKAAWVGNVSAGTGYRFRSAVESGDLTVEDHSNFSIALALQAAAMGVPYLPTRSLLGSDIFEQHPRMRRDRDPFSNEPIALVPAEHPDWAVVHAQRACPAGDAHTWGNLGITLPAVGAAENVLLTVEEIVDEQVIRSDPSRVSITRDQVDAVVESPYGAHPSPLAGYYNRDNEYYLSYRDRSGTAEDFDDWANEWVYGVDDREAYRELITADLSITERSIAAEVEYGQ